MAGKVYITGAGPGDIELLTLKALRVIKEADIILHDRLINEDILKFAKEACELVYVGKEDGKHTLPQDEINELLYQNALKHQSVVRLKGGDPFVFGRGSEEALYLAERGVSFEIVPGVSSATGAIAYAGIPLTHRGINTSFRVITGHQISHSSAEFDFGERRENETLVILMGLNRLEKLVEKLLEKNYTLATPCAVVQDGTTKEQKVAVGTLESITKEAQDFESPSIIIVGEVVLLRDKLSWFS